MPRPHRTVVEQRGDDFLRLLADTGSVSEAAKQSKADPGRILSLMDSDEYFEVVTALRSGREWMVAVKLASPLEQAA